MAPDGIANGKRDLPTPVRLLMLLAVLALFFVSINLMGASLKAMTKSTVEDLLREATSNPLVGLLLGILATSIIQSSSTTTTIVVSFAAFGTIDLAGAIPIVMGANIGTTVTNTIVSFMHIRRKQEFERALAAGTVHDFFNVLATMVLFPLEYFTGVLGKAAVWLQDLIIGQSIGELGGLKAVIGPVVETLMNLLSAPWLSLVVSLLLLFLSLTLLVKIMRALFIQKMARIIDRILFRNAVNAFLLGVLFTVMVQSSSVTTSLVVPLVGAGMLTLEQVFPYTLGANVGTTITAFLAALAAAALPAAGATAGVGLTVAIVHLLFNLFGILLISPIQFVPIFLARWLARTMSTSRRKAVLFLLCYFALYLTPLAILLLF